MGVEDLEDEGVNPKEAESKFFQSETSNLKKTRKISDQELLLWTAQLVFTMTTKTNQLRGEESVTQISTAEKKCMEEIRILDLVVDLEIQNR